MGKENRVRHVSRFGAHTVFYVTCCPLCVCACGVSSWQVDFVLLGGDLFHDNTPSRSTVYRCVRLACPIRICCLDDGSAGCW